MTSFPAPGRLTRKTYTDPPGTREFSPINVLPPDSRLLERIGVFSDGNKNKIQALLDKSPASMEVWRLLTEHGVDFIESQVTGNLAPCIKVGDAVYEGLEPIKEFIEANYQIIKRAPPSHSEAPVVVLDDPLESLAKWVS